MTWNGFGNQLTVILDWSGMCRIQKHLTVQRVLHGLNGLLEGKQISANQVLKNEFKNKTHKLKHYE